MLPALPPRRVRRICSHIEFVTTRYFRRAETIFADLADARTDPALRQMLDPLTSMQRSTRFTERMWSLLCGTGLRGEARRDPRSFGYMLRCFFDGCRRAVALEEALMLLIGAGIERQGAA